MKSEVEKNKSNIRVGDILYYVDAENCIKFTVLEVNEKGVTVDSLDAEHSEPCFYMFSGMQIGWEISEKTKEYNRINFRTEYV